jgi:hypothetical protein
VRQVGYLQELNGDATKHKRQKAQPVKTEEFTYEQYKQSRMANNQQHAKTVNRPCFKYHGMKVYSGSVGEVSRTLSLQDVEVKGHLLRH